MTVRGGQTFAAKTRGFAIAGWARAALALAMAVLLSAQAAAMHVDGAAGTDAAALAYQKCEKVGAAASGAEAPGNAAVPHHDCDACLACAFSAALDARLAFHMAPRTAAARVILLPGGILAPPAQRNAAHPARAPPPLS